MLADAQHFAGHAVTAPMGLKADRFVIIERCAILSADIALDCWQIRFAGAG
jgi:hypothetical protein